MKKIAFAAGAVATIAIGVALLQPQMRALATVPETAPAPCKKLKPCFTRTNQGAGAAIKGISLDSTIGKFGQAAILAQADGLGGVYSFSKQFYGGEFESGGSSYALVAATDNAAGTAFLAEGPHNGAGPEIQAISENPNPSATGAAVVVRAAGLTGVSASSKQGYGGEFQSSTGAGVLGISTTNSVGSFGQAAILAQANGLGGVYSYSKEFYGGEFETGGATYALIAATDNDQGVGFLAEGSPHGLGPEVEALSVRPELTHQNQAAIVAQAYGLSGVYGFSSLNAGGAFESLSGTSLVAQADASNGISFAAQGPGGFTIFDGSGNGNFTGTVAAAGYITVSSQNGEKAVAAYGAAATRPLIEDVGTARLTNGVGVVRFDSALAGAIDVRNGYQVFLTADGDVRGLYVAQKFARGFVIRESQGGRSSILFDYRIVAHRAGLPDARLPEIQVPKQPHLFHHRALLAPRLTPARQP